VDLEVAAIDEAVVDLKDVEGLEKDSKNIPNP
jgi:hypothetical protein